MCRGSYWVNNRYVYIHSFSSEAEFSILNYSDSSDHICRLKLAEVWSQEAIPLLPFTVFGGGFVGTCFCSWTQWLGLLWRVGATCKCQVPVPQTLSCLLCRELNHHALYQHGRITRFYHFAKSECVQVFKLEHLWSIENVLWLLTHRGGKGAGDDWEVQAASFITNRGLLFLIFPDYLD